MQITLIVVGKTIGKNLIELLEEYINRLSVYIKFRILIIKEEKFKTSIDTEILKKKESNQILKQINQNDLIILLDEKGITLSSVDFSTYLFKKLASSGKNITFVLGGAYGFSKEFYQKFPNKLSLSKMTLTHQMTRLFFIEQLYRACKIWKNEPYHH